MKTKIITIVLLVFIVTAGFAQTIEIEKEVINAKIKDNKKNQKKALQLGEAWTQLIEDNGGYPKLPYDQETNMIQYEFVTKVPAAKKESIMQGLKEWIGINFKEHMIDGKVITYEDAKAGKVVVSGWYPYSNDMPKEESNEITNDFSLVGPTFTIIYTIKDQAFKTEFQDIALQVHSSKRGLTNKSKKAIESYYPITANKYQHWEHYKYILNRTDAKIKHIQKDQADFLIKRGDSFDF